MTSAGCTGRLSHINVTGLLLRHAAYSSTVSWKRIIKWINAKRVQTLKFPRIEFPRKQENYCFPISVLSRTMYVNCRSRHFPLKKCGPQVHVSWNDIKPALLFPLGEGPSGYDSLYLTDINDGTYSMSDSCILLVTNPHSVLLTTSDIIQPMAPGVRNILTVSTNWLLILPLYVYRIHHGQN